MKRKITFEEADNLRKRFLPNSDRDSDNFNYRHPELRDGEIWINNENPSLDKRRPLRFDHSSTVHGRPWKSKRLGIKAYDVTGNDITNEGYIPVFVQRAELEAAGYNPDKINSWSEIIKEAVAIVNRGAD